LVRALVLVEISEYYMIYLDTETALIEQGLLAPPLTCAQFAIDGGPVGVAVAGVDPVEDLCRELLEGEICGHNVAYDTLVLMTEYPDLQEAIFSAYDEGRVTDTLIREKLLHIRAGTLKTSGSMSLSALAKKYGAEKDGQDPWRLRYAELRGVPFEHWPSGAREYARHDIEATRHVYLAQSATEIPDERRQAKYALLMHCIEAQGVHTDPVAVAQFQGEIQRAFDDGEALLKSEGLVRPDGTKDTKAAKELMKSVLGDQCLLTKTGQISLDEEACTLSGHSTLLAYQLYGSRKNLLSRMESMKKGFQKPLNARFDSLVSTGRTSCSIGDYGYQLHNMLRIPGERECFIPRPGNVFLACDFDGFELATLAQVCLWAVGESRLAQVINAGMDVHLFRAAETLGEPYEELMGILSTLDHPRRKEIKEVRQLCKIANFGYPGGMGPKSFIKFARPQGVHLDLGQAQELKDEWLKSLPEMTKYFNWISNGHQWRQVVRKSGVWDVTTIKQFRSDRVRGGVSFTEACNSYFQGLAADAAKSAGWEILKACYRGEMSGWRIWNFVHDEYLLEGPEESAAEAACIVQEIMESEAQKWIPDVKISASPCLMRRWRKDAEPVYRNGMLIPWEDRKL